MLEEKLQIFYIFLLSFQLVFFKVGKLIPLRIFSFLASYFYIIQSQRASIKIKENVRETREGVELVRITSAFFKC